MAELPPWNDLIAGKGCPFCALPPEQNEYMIKIADLGVSTMYLERNQTYRGYCLVIFNKRHVTGIEHLTAEEHAQYSRDIKNAAEAISKTVQPDHMNYATLGNVMPHLHYHLIPRYKDDGRWGAPVWTSKLAEMADKKLDEAAYAALAGDIRRNLVL
jgi:diadenosine tetraphosphate (Ap4A) HIT family hydrolase